MILTAVTRFTGHYYSTEVRSVLAVGVAIRQRYDPAVLRMQRRTCLIWKVIIQSYVWTEREGAERTEEKLATLVHLFIFFRHAPLFPRWVSPPVDSTDQPYIKLRRDADYNRSLTIPLFYFKACANDRLDAGTKHLPPPSHSSLLPLTGSAIPWGLQWIDKRGFDVR